jgi:hypothetical protein
VNGGSSASEVEDVVPFGVEDGSGELENDVVVDEVEAGVGAVMLEVDSLASVEIVEDGDIGAFSESAINNVRANETSSTSNENILSRLEGNRHFAFIYIKNLK